MANRKELIAMANTKPGLHTEVGLAPADSFSGTQRTADTDRGVSTSSMFHASQDEA
ncbi:hypothetical protein [Comamonas serinivorans]|uniref:hypothetical protein n=1 Tax=Comamonas serinivorans TaxID=1082851 RepID=UPI0012FACAEF|nr:hypothetical protein [Comamonas serinivorans]